MKVPDVRQILADKASYVFMKRYVECEKTSGKLRIYTARELIKFSAAEVVNGDSNNGDIFASNRHVKSEIFGDRKTKLIGKSSIRDSDDFKEELGLSDK